MGLNVILQDMGIGFEMTDYTTSCEDAATRRANVLRKWNKKLAKQRIGTKASEEHKTKISEGLKKAWSEGKRKDYTYCDIYRRWVRKGVNPILAMYKADCWMKRKAI